MLKHTYRPITIAILTTLLMLGCSSKDDNIYVIDNTNSRTIDSLDGLHAMGSHTTGKGSKKEVSPIRRTAIEETAMSIGAQAALAWRGRIINSELQRNNRYLDHVFDFNSLILQDNVLPPVLLEGRKLLNLDNPNTIRIADLTYKIDKQARFVTTPPNWREYLWLGYEAPSAPHHTLLPKNSEEREIWDAFVVSGWERGRQQADIIFGENLARLKEDYLGMILYRKLLAQNMVSPPYVARTELGVTGDSTQINIDDQVLRITAHPALNPDSADWNPAVSIREEEHLLQQQIEKLIDQAEITWDDSRWHPVIENIERAEY